MKISNIPLIDAPLSLGGNIELPTFYVGNIYAYSIQLVFSGTPNGVFKLQCSNDPGVPTGSTRIVQTGLVLNWTDIANSSQDISGAGNHTWNVQDCAYMWARVVFTYTSDTGNLNVARLVVKGV
jgi:hypothetical protein